MTPLQALDALQTILGPYTNPRKTKTMEFTLSIKMDNAAFIDGPDELPNILHGLANRVEDLNPDEISSGSITDSNGNKVGRWEIAEERTAIGLTPEELRQADIDFARIKELSP